MWKLYQNILFQCESSDIPKSIGNQLSFNVLSTPVWHVQQTFRVHVIYRCKSYFSLSQKRLHLIYLYLYKIHNKTEKVGQTNTSLLNTQAQIHTVQCSEDKAHDPFAPLYPLTEAGKYCGSLNYTLGHRISREQGPKDTLRTSSAFILYLWGFWTCFPLLVAACPARAFSPQSIGKVLWPTHTNAESGPGV